MGVAAHAPRRAPAMPRSCIQAWRARKLLRVVVGVQQWCRHIFFVGGGSCRLPKQEGECMEDVNPQTKKLFAVLVLYIGSFVSSPP